MEYYKVFVKVLLKEIGKFNLDPEVYSTYVTQLTASLDENFDVSYNRCAYMFRCATANIYFFNDCVKKFLCEYSNTNNIISLWKSYNEVKVCSLSVGPGIDYLGFLLAILEYDPSPPNFNNLKIVTKHGAWRNTVNLILEVFREQGLVFGVSWQKLKYGNVGVIHTTDLCKSYTNNRTILAVGEANVILMMKTINLLAPGTTQEGPLLHMLKKLVDSLKSEAIIFCIDTKPSVAVLTQALMHFPGKFLYGPIHQTVKLPCDLPEVVGNHPIVSIRGAFFVWQKLTNSASSNLCTTTPLANVSVSKEKKEDNVTAAFSSDNKSNPLTVENDMKIEDKYSDSHSFFNLQNTLHEGTSSDSVDSLSPYGTLNSLSSVTCEKDSSSSSIDGKSTGTIPKRSGHAAVRKGDTLTQVNPAKIGSCENKVIQTDKQCDIPTGSSSVKALTERIRQLAISLESVSERNEPCNYDGGDCNQPRNCHTDGLHNFTPRNDACTTDKPCLKQSPSCGFENQDNLPSCESEAEKNVLFQNAGCHYNCQCFHNRCYMHCCSMSCDFQPCCAPQPVARCNFSCNRPQSLDNNLGNFTSPTIVIPVQHISDNAMLQIISVLKSESKK